MRSLGWVPTQYDYCPYKKRLGHRRTQREDQVGTQGEDGHPQAKEKGVRRNPPCPHLGLDFQPPAREKISFCANRSLVLCYDSRGNLSTPGHQRASTVCRHSTRALGTWRGNSLSLPSRARGRWGREKSARVIVMGGLGPQVSRGRNALRCRNESGGLPRGGSTRAEARRGGRKQPRGQRSCRGTKTDRGCWATAPWRAHTVKGLRPHGDFR